MPRSSFKGRRPSVDAPSRGAGSLRLIGGQFRGRRLKIADIEGLRPTGDRQREILFNWLQFDLPGARAVDLFAGTGALGLEAASRGADQVWLVERHPKAVAQLREAVEQLQCQAEVVSADAVQWLAQTDAGPFDIVFVDPPFSQELWQPALSGLVEYQRLAKGAWVYVESPVAHSVQVTAEFALRKEKITGDVKLRLYQWQG